MEHPEHADVDKRREIWRGAAKRQEQELRSARADLAACREALKTLATTAEEAARLIAAVGVFPPKDPANLVNLKAAKTYARGLDGAALDARALLARLKGR